MVSRKGLREVETIQKKGRAKSSPKVPRRARQIQRYHMALFLTAYRPS
jgi:hypothetical protein